MSQEFVLISCFDDSHKLLRKYARLWKYLWLLEKFCSTFFLMLKYDKSMKHKSSL